MCSQAARSPSPSLHRLRFPHNVPHGPRGSWLVSHELKDRHIGKQGLEVFLALVAEPQNAGVCTGASVSPVSDWCIRVLSWMIQADNIVGRIAEQVSEVHALDVDVLLGHG